MKTFLGQKCGRFLTGFPFFGAETEGYLGLAPQIAHLSETIGHFACFKGTFWGGNEAERLSKKNSRKAALVFILRLCS